jgi:hypothetical protein
LMVNLSRIQGEAGRLRQKQLLLRLPRTVMAKKRLS